MCLVSISPRFKFFLSIFLYALLCSCNNEKDIRIEKDVLLLPCDFAKTASVCISSEDSTLYLASSFKGEERGIIKLYKSIDAGDHWDSFSTLFYDDYVRIIGFEYFDGMFKLLIEHRDSDMNKLGEEVLVSDCPQGSWSASVDSKLPANNGVFLSDDGKYLMKKSKAMVLDTLLKYENKLNMSSLNMSYPFVADNFLAVRCGWDLMFYSISGSTVEYVGKLEKPSNFGTRIPIVLIKTGNNLYLSVRNLSREAHILSYVSLNGGRDWNIIGNRSIDAALKNKSFSIFNENGRFFMERTEFMENRK